MFVNFDEVFNGNPQTDMRIPDALAEKLSDELPEGFKYIVSKSGDNMVISSTNNSNVTIGGMLIVPTANQLATLGTEFSFSDILKYAYNSQQEIPIKLQDENSIILNGECIPIDKIVCNPLKPFKLDFSKTYLIPEPFPPKFNISIGCDLATLELTIKRIPNESVDTMAFESQGESCLHLKYYINLETETPSFQISISISISKAKTVKEIIDSINIYNAFVNGEGFLAENPIKPKIEKDNLHEFNKENLQFWTKVYELEKKLDITFLPPYSVDFEDICIIEEIYQNIINKKPIRTNKKITSISSKWEYRKKNIDEEIGKSVYFEANGTDSFELFGKKIDFWHIYGVFNAVISKYEENDDDLTIYFEPQAEDKPIYISCLRFLSKSEMKEYKDNTKNRIFIFMEAKKVEEYLF